MISADKTKFLLKSSYKVPQSTYLNIYTCILNLDGGVTPVVDL